MPSLDTQSSQLQPSSAKSLLKSLIPLAVGVVIAIILQILVRPLLGDYASKIALDVTINIVLAVSLTMVNGFTGQFSIGHAAFMAVGAYTAACIVYYGSFRFFGDASVHGGLLSTMQTERDPAPPLLTLADGFFALAILAGGAVAALCGYIVGLPSLRLKGDYLAIVTLGFGEIVRVLLTLSDEVPYDTDTIASLSAYKYPLYLGGGLGFSGLPFYTSLFWGGLLACITLIVAFRLKMSSQGRAFLSIREDEIAAEAMGVNTTKYKVRAFVIAAFFAGLAGGVFAHTNGVQLNPGELGFMKSFDIIIMVVLGGLGSISGAAIAALILTVLPELLREPPSIWPYGLIGGLILAAACVPFSRRRWKPFLVVGLMLAVWEGLRQLAFAADIQLSEFRMVLYALALIVMMIARPQGLLGLRELWDLRVARRKPPAPIAKGAAK